MRRGRAGVGVGLLLALAGTQPARAATALVLSQTSAQLTALDTETAVVRGTLQLDTGPANIALSADRKAAYVAHPNLSQITIVDLAAWNVTATRKVTGAPFGLAVTPNGRLVVGDWTGDRIYAIDTATGDEQGSAIVGKAPAHLAVSHDGKTILAAAREADQVAAVDVETFKTTSIIPLGRAPFALAVSPDGKRAAVANAQSATLSIIDLATLKVTETLRTGPMPYGVVVTQDNAQAIVTNQQSGTLSVLSLAANGAPAASPTRVGSYPEGIALTADGARAFVTNWFSDDVSIIDVASGAQTARVKVSGGPRAVVVTPEDVGR